MKKISWAGISKEVGWDDIEIPYPEEKIVEDLRERAYSADRNALVSLLRYHRFCKVALNEEQRRTINRIMGILFSCKRMFCE